MLCHPLNPRPTEVSNGVGSMEELYGGNGYDRYTNDGVAH